MAEQTTARELQEKRIEDYLTQASLVLFGIAAILFAGGLYMDVFVPGENLVPLFKLADEPYANSGLLISAILVGIFGYIVSRVGAIIEARRRAGMETEEKQEWVVDV
ncbi:MAG: hypothetical protein ABEJ58_04340 [Halodesulfurarchaeum sp.]